MAKGGSSFKAKLLAIRNIIDGMIQELEREEQQASQAGTPKKRRSRKETEEELMAWFTMHHINGTWGKPPMARGKKAKSTNKKKPE